MKEKSVNNFIKLPFEIHNWSVKLPPKNAWVLARWNADDRFRRVRTCNRGCCVREDDLSGHWGLPIEWVECPQRQSSPSGDASKNAYDILHDEIDNMVIEQMLDRWYGHDDMIKTSHIIPTIILQNAVHMLDGVHVDRNTKKIILLKESNIDENIGNLFINIGNILENVLGDDLRMITQNYMKIKIRIEEEFCILDSLNYEIYESEGSPKINGFKIVVDKSTNHINLYCSENKTSLEMINNRI